MAPCAVVNWWGGGGVLSHSALAEVEGGAELLVGDSEGVLVHVREGGLAAFGKTIREGGLAAFQTPSSQLNMPNKALRPDHKHYLWLS